MLDYAPDGNGTYLLEELEVLSSSQCSTNRPLETRQMSIECISISAPLGGTPRNSLVWRPGR